MSGWEPVRFILEGEDWEPGEVAFILKTDGEGVTIRDLRVAAAAPELLEALTFYVEIEERCLANDQIPTIELDQCLNMARDAILKATGGDQ